MKLPTLGLWFWRRLLAWAAIMAVHVTIGWIVWASPGAAYLGNVALGLIAEAIIVFTFYFSGATVTEWAKLAGSVSGAMKVNLFGVSAPATPPPPSSQEPSP